MRCAEVREVLAAYERPADADLAVRRHLAGCAGCRRELERYENLRDAVSSLTRSTMDIPDGLTAKLVAIPANERLVDSVRGHVVRHRAAYLGGLAAAVAGTGAVLWRVRSRRPVAA